MKKCNKVALYERYLAQINREDTLINSRLSWFLTSQGLFIAALSINSETSKMIKYPIIILGILISIITLTIGIMAKNSLMNLYFGWKKEKIHIKPPLFGIQRGGVWIYFNFLSPPILFPIFFIVFWICFLILLFQF